MSFLCVFNSFCFWVRIFMSFFCFLHFLCVFSSLRFCIGLFGLIVWPIRSGKKAVKRVKIVSFYFIQLSYSSGIIKNGLEPLLKLDVIPCTRTSFSHCLVMLLRM